MILASNIMFSSQNWELFDTEELVGEFGCIYVRVRRLSFMTPLHCQSAELATGELQTLPLSEI